MPLKAVDALDGEPLQPTRGEYTSWLFDRLVIGLTVVSSTYLLEGSPRSTESPWEGWRFLTLETRMEPCHEKCRKGSRPRVGTHPRRGLLRCGWSGPYARRSGPSENDKPIWPHCDGADSSEGRNTAYVGMSVARRAAGVSQPSVLRGRVLSSAATSSRCDAGCKDRSEPLGNQSRSSPLTLLCQEAGWCWAMWCCHWARSWDMAR